jgi:hypothetical protein
MISRPLGSAAAGLLTVLLFLGTSAGPVQADERTPVHSAVAPAGVPRPALSGLLTLLIGAGLVLVARRDPNGPGSGRT